MTLFWIGIGGALGAVMRYLSVVAAARLLGPGFPWGTVFVNVAGSLAMGVAAALLVERLADERAIAFVLPGVLGGFTTFSAFSLDAFRLYEAGRMGEAAVYVGGSVVVSILALAAGLMIGRSLA